MQPQQPQVRASRWTSWWKAATRLLTGAIVCSMTPNAYIRCACMESGKAVLLRRQATDQLADALRSDGSSLMRQAVKQGVLDPKQCCRVSKHHVPGLLQWNLVMHLLCPCDDAPVHSLPPCLSAIPRHCTSIARQRCHFQDLA